MTKQYDVLVVGGYCLDLIFTGLPRMPELGIEIVANHFDMVPGGAYNAAVAMHRLGLAVGWATDFGSDDFSNFVRTHAIQEGLDPSLFIQHDRPLRSITVAASYPQDRAFIAYYDPEPSFPAGLKALSKAKSKVLYVTGLYYGPGLGVGLQVLRHKKMLLVMDGNCSHTDTLSNPDIRKAIASTDIFMPNSSEVKLLTGVSDLQAGIRTLAGLSRLLVVKDGARGAYAVTPQETCFAPAIDVSPLDTTGAGDCFNAGFMRAHLKGLPLEECLRWGNIVGGLSTLALGGSGYAVHEAEVLEWLARS